VVAGIAVGSGAVFVAMVVVIACIVKRRRHPEPQTMESSMLATQDPGMRYVA
jgi:hypothetical protein